MSIDSSYMLTPTPRAQTTAQAGPMRINTFRMPCGRPAQEHDIWVAQGTYRPDEDTNHPGGTDSRTATFQLINGVALYGGFPSGAGCGQAETPTYTIPSLAEI